MNNHVITKNSRIDECNYVKTAMSLTVNRNNQQALLSNADSL